MQLLRLKLENFKCHRYTDIDCSDFQGVLIVGRSKNDERDSNASGKSSILSGIIYALFDEYDTKTIDKLVRNGCDVAKVILEFSIDSDIYRLQRTRNKKTSKSDLRIWHKNGDDWMDISCKTNTETELELAKLIKITYPTFRNSVFFAQSDIQGLSSLTSPDKRKMILKEALNLSVYSKYEKRAREKSSELAKKIAGHKAVVSLLGKPTDDIILYNKQLSEVNEAIKVKEAEQEQLIIAAAEYKDNLALLQKSIGSEAVDVQNKLQDLNKLKIKTQNDLDKTNKFILEKENILKILQERKNNKEKTLKQLIKEYDGHKEVICREQSVIKEDLKKASENENNGKAHIISLENKLKELQKPFPTGSKCPQCRQAVQEEHRNECLIKISTEISSFLEDISSKKKMLESIGIKKIKLENELSSAVEHISTCNSLKYQIENKKNDIQSDIEYYKQAEEMISFLIKERDIHSNNLLASCVKEQELQDLIKEINIDNTNLKIFNIKSEIKKINEKLSAIISDISSLRIETGSIAEKISSKEKNLTQLQELNSTIKTLEKEYKIKQIVVQGFSSSGIPTVIIYTILDDLQIEANKILQELRPGLELQFSIIKSKNDGQQEDTLDISYRLRGVEYEGEQLSGGQKMLIALSLRIGLAFVIQRRLGIDIKFLALDEVDEKLDEGRVEAFMSLIKKLQQTHKVFVISHNKNLQKRFSKIIMVENDEENGSTAKVSDLW